MSTDVKKEINKSSLLNKIIERFNNELIEMERQSESILKKVCLLKDARSPKPEDLKEKRDDQGGIIADLENHLDKMNDLNDVLRQVNDGLATSVG